MSLIATVCTLVCMSLKIFVLLHYFHCGLLSNLNESTLLSSISLASRTIQ